MKFTRLNSALKELLQKMKKLIIIIKVFALIVTSLSVMIGIYSYYSNPELIGRYGIPIIDMNLISFLRDRLALYALFIGLSFSLRFDALGWYLLVFAVVLNFVLEILNAFIPPFDQGAYNLFKISLWFFCLFGLYAQNIRKLYSVDRINYFSILSFVVVSILIWF